MCSNEKGKDEEEAWDLKVVAKLGSLREVPRRLTTIKTVANNDVRSNTYLNGM